VINIGGGVKQYQALVSPDKLTQFGITIEDVATALEKSNVNTTGGFVDAQSQEYLIRNLARFYSLDELKNTVVAYRNNTAIKLGDVAAGRVRAEDQAGRRRDGRRARRHHVRPETAGRIHHRDHEEG
jgi:Cu/Ag efflux pump CusA